MINPNEAPEIKKLIQKFDLDLISFELDIPIEELKSLKAEMERKKDDSAKKPKDVTENRYIRAHSILEQMRVRYKRLFQGENNNPREKKEQTENELKTINSVTATIRQIVNGLECASDWEKRKGAIIAMQELNKVQSITLTIEQAKEICGLMKSEHFNNLRGIASDTLDINISMQRKREMAGSKLTQAIAIAKAKTNNIDELKNLKNMVIKLELEDGVLDASAIRIQIDSKITEIKNKNAMNRFRENIPESILLIAEDIAKGKLDIRKANEIIEEEAKRRVENGPRTKFALTEAQEKGQLLIKLKTVISEQSERFNIDNPEQATLQLSELCGGDMYGAVNTIVSNLLATKKFDLAKQVCSRFCLLNSNKEDNYRARNLRALIKNAEFGEAVLKALNRAGTAEEELAYYEFIENGINTQKVNPRFISLGKSEDGTKSITLADILVQQKQR